VLEPALCPGAGAAERSQETPLKDRKKRCINPKRVLWSIYFYCIKGFEILNSGEFLFNKSSRL
jgi:hypothetical protein